VKKTFASLLLNKSPASVFNPYTPNKEEYAKSMYAFA